MASDNISYAIGPQTSSEAAAVRDFANTHNIIVVSQESVHEWQDVYGTVIHSALTEGRELAA